MRCVLAHQFFFFNDTATTEIYTLSLHDALPISSRRGRSPQCGIDRRAVRAVASDPRVPETGGRARGVARLEEHTPELQSRLHIVCPPLHEKKKYCKGLGPPTSAPPRQRPAPSTD